MTTTQFADMSKDLLTQVHIIEDMVKSSVFKKAVSKLSAAKVTCDNLESLIEPDNHIQIRIVTNRRREITWLDNTIQAALAKSPKASAEKRSSKKI